MSHHIPESNLCALGEDKKEGFGRQNQNGARLAAKRIMNSESEADVALSLAPFDDKFLQVLGDFGREE